MSVSYYGPLSTLNAVRANIEQCPRRAVVKGGLDKLPKVYAAGSPGWSDHVMAAPYSFNATYKLDVPDTIEVKPAPGKTRICVLTLGESGMVGYDNATNWATVVPAGYGYPNLVGDVWRYDANGWSVVIEYSHGFGFGPAGLFCYLLQQQLGAAYEVALIPCAVGGTTSQAWAVGGTLYNTAVARAKAALALERTTLGVILQEQGINDAAGNSSAGWAARWSAIVQALRVELGGTQAPLYYARHCPTRPSAITGAEWAVLLAEQDSWSSLYTPRRVPVQKPDGPWIEGASGTHLLAGPQATLASRYLDAWIGAH